ncbi:YkgJ family cysteine cluster protein [bacterium]|nr:YkgJ family cysteine cluster protein [bacterium]
MSDAFWKKGLRFECQGSGKCCVSRGGYGFVYLSQRDRTRLARHLEMPTRLFTRTYCTKTDGWWHLKDMEGPCQFLKGKRCSVYEARPIQCRTWPFWPENLKPKVWNEEVASFCPGVGKGRLHSAAEIRAQVRQDSWDQ